MNPCEIEGRPFWRSISDAGRRVAVIDVPHSHAGEQLNGIEISEWGCHDRHFGLRGSPDGIVGELTARHGLHPVLGIDAYAERHFAPDDEFARTGPLRTADEDRGADRGPARGDRGQAPAGARPARARALGPLPLRVRREPRRRPSPLAPPRPRAPAPRPRRRRRARRPAGTGLRSARRGGRRAPGALRARDDLRPAAQPRHVGTPRRHAPARGGAAPPRRVRARGPGGDAALPESPSARSSGCRPRPAGRRAVRRPR